MKVLVFAFLVCCVLLLVSYADANRNRKPVQKPSRQVAKRRPPTRKRPPVNLRRGIKAANTKYVDSSWCDADYLDDMFVHEECDMFYYCDENLEIFEDYCEEGDVFDFEFLECTPIDEGGWCAAWNEESECPQNSNDLVFLPGEDCETYFICINGTPQLWNCAPGQHWNKDFNFCDKPSNARCDPNALDPIVRTLPECHGIDGTIPHPFNCELFIYCQRNGNRLIQHCPHLNHYDEVTKTCVSILRSNCQPQTPFRRH